MSFKKHLLAALFLSLILATPTLAQNGGGTAVEFWQTVVGLITAWIGGGAIGSFLTDLLKRLAWLSDEGRSRISGTGAEFLAAVLTVGLATLTELVWPYLTFLDESGIWAIVLAIAAALPAHYFGQVTYRLKRG